ncbi:MAG: hypothetical protein FWB75_09015 [Oscillospiraceae bacterium]|nr:hypothetical protein [Oscillospiraceae bacterium]
MQIDVKKVENCFAGSRSYEYKLPIDGECFFELLDGWEKKEHHKYRRPLFTADRDGVNIKGILKANTIKVSFPAANWEAAKESFESWLVDNVE